MSGNVWEWCADRWTSEHGTDTEDRTDTEPGDARVIRGGARVIWGGSRLYHASYCNRYRVAARTANTPDSSTGHTGFRCVRGAG